MVNYYNDDDVDDWVSEKDGLKDKVIGIFCHNVYPNHLFCDLCSHKGTFTSDMEKHLKQKHDEEFDKLKEVVNLLLQGGKDRIEVDGY